MTAVPAARTRVALLLVSLAVIGLELALMRVLSLRFWSHLAYMIISVALLGFGASGTLLAVFRGRVLARPRKWLWVSATAFAVSVPVAACLIRVVPLNVRFLAWDLAQIGWVAAIELVMLVPFVLAGTMVGVALMDRPERIGGHYAANLAGSGAGAVLFVLLMFALSTEGVLVAAAVAAWAGAAAVVPWRSAWPRAIACAAAAAVTVGAGFALRPTPLSQYKMLSQLRLTPGTEEIYHAEGPLGRIDVVAGSALHTAPGLSLQYRGDPPPHALLMVDGETAGMIYDCKQKDDWEFMDYTTAAAAYHVTRRPRVLVVGAGGGSGIGLAVFHDSPRVVALEMNGQIISAMRGALARLGGRIYDRPHVTVVNREARGYLAAGAEQFDVIQLPAVGEIGSTGSGVQAAQESFLLTVESFSRMLDRLSDRGVLCVTRPARDPPRDGLRIFAIAAEALRQRGLEPGPRLAMLRNWSSVSVLVAKVPLSSRQTAELRRFCRRRGFDLAWLADLSPDETNKYHVLDRPHYFHAARALLGLRRREFLADYLFDVAPTTDDRPYFFRFFRWRSLPELRRRLGGRSPAFLEVGYFVLVATLVQSVPVAVVLILLPLAPKLGALKRVRGKAATFGYFLLLGAGFMLLEMGLLHKLRLYMAHPIYAAAVVIGSFLLFAGAGSALGPRWRASPGRVITVAGAVVVGVSLVYALFLDAWLSLTQPLGMWVRFAVAAGTIAPVAVAMGHMFPAGLRTLSGGSAALVPWAWAVNGFASVTATVAAPLLAMEIGFARLTLAAVACYALAAGLARLLPGRVGRLNR